MAVKIIVGDCRVPMAAMEPESISAVVTDPPYGLEFMGMEWDKLWDKRAGDPVNHPKGQAWAKENGRKSGNKGYAGLTSSPNYRAGKAAQDWHHSWAIEAFRVLKPGGHILAFGGTRTFHRMTVAIEDAGFEIRDCLSWLYGSGFPKSLDVSKAIDKAAGAEREVTGPATRHSGQSYQWAGEVRHPTHSEDKAAITTPATPAAEQWDGWGTALKPAWEPIIVARKPLIGTVAANVLTNGTGAINVDGCRIGTDGEQLQSSSSNLSKYRGNVYFDSSTINIPSEQHPQGRWPANVVLGCCGNDPHDPDCAAAMLDEQSGERPSGAMNGSYKGAGNGVAYGQFGYADRHIEASTGGPSRFFYTSKSSRSERNKGLDGMPERDAGTFAQDEWSRDHMGNTPDAKRMPVANHHPTVKPVDLMQWLVRLVTPPGGIVLDPFMGSGSTCIAADREGFDCIGIEISAEYVEIARRRIVGDCPMFAEVIT